MSPFAYLGLLVVFGAFVEAIRLTFGFNFINSAVVSLICTMGPIFAFQKFIDPRKWASNSDRFLKIHIVGCLTIAVLASFFLFPNIDGKEAVYAFIFIAGVSGPLMAVVVLALASAMEDETPHMPNLRPSPQQTPIYSEDAALFGFDQGRFTGEGTGDKEPTARRVPAVRPD